MCVYTLRLILFLHCLIERRSGAAGGELCKKSLICLIDVQDE